MQVWENFTIVTDANCGCCGGNVCSPSVTANCQVNFAASWQCVGDPGSETCEDGGPVSFNFCISVFNPVEPNACGEGIPCPPTEQTTIGQFMGICECLTPNVNYSIVSIWEDGAMNTTNVYINFTASAASENTNWVNGPTPNITHEIWTMANISISAV